MGYDCQARVALWNNLVNVRFRAFYYERTATWVSRCDTGLNIVVAVLTTGSAGVWLRDKERAALCATVIFITQLVGVLKKNLPWLKRATMFDRCAQAYSKLFIAVEQAWRECERGESAEAYEKALTKIRESEHKLETHYCELPAGEIRLIHRWADARMREFFELNFPSRP